MVLNTISVGAAVTPTVIETYFDHVRFVISSMRRSILTSISTSITNPYAKNRRHTSPTMKAFVSSVKFCYTPLTIPSKTSKHLRLNGFPVRSG